MSWLSPKISDNDDKILHKDSVFYRLKIYASKIGNDAKKWTKKVVSGGHKYRLQFLIVPLVLIVCLVVVLLLDGADERGKDATMNMVRVDNPAISLVYDVDRDGNVTSAWLRTPKTSRRLGQLDGLAYIGDSKFYSDVDGDGKEDLLWRISFNNEREHAGVHIWIGSLSGLGKIYVCSSPYEYTRWDAIPTKIRTPRNCAVYVSPGIPGTEYRGKECYSFIYTIELAADGPAFVPVASVYKQLFPILRVASNAEEDPDLRKAYINMLTEYRDLSDGKAPSAETITALRMENIDLIPLK